MRVLSIGMRMLFEKWPGRATPGGQNVGIDESQVERCATSLPSERGVA